MMNQLPQPPLSSTTSAQFPRIGSVPDNRSTSTGGVAGNSEVRVMDGDAIVSVESIGDSTNSKILKSSLLRTAWELLVIPS